MDQIDFARETGEEERFFRGAVAAAEDDVVGVTKTGRNILREIWGVAPRDGVLGPEIVGQAVNVSMDAGAAVDRRGADGERGELDVGTVDSWDWKF